jgi:uncharacterized protein (TIGR02147 family)
MKSLEIIYSYSDYKKFVSAREEHFGKFEKGFRSRLSEALNVQTAFISKVLNTPKAHFNLEQGLLLANFLKLNDDETSYLVWLIEFARAGTKDLKRFFHKRIEEAQQQHLNIKNRVGDSVTLSAQDQNRFYSHWMYGAAHVLTSIPSYQAPEKIAEALRMDQKLVREVLTFLLSSGLVQDKGGRFVIGPTQLHLSKNSANISKHHTNWRLKAIDDSADPNSEGIHYSTVSSLSLNDFNQLKFDLTEVIQRYVETIRKSPEETASCFNLDFFRIIS